MMTLTFAFWVYVVIFAIIGAMRGWAKELLVAFSVILALFLLEVFSRYVPPVRDFFAKPNGTPEFWVRTALMLFLVVFGYQTPNIPKFQTSKFARERLADTLLGFFLGALNGFLIFGTLWYFLDDSGYPFHKFISRPEPPPSVLAYLPPKWLGVPTIYIAVAVSFLFVLVVFL